MKPIIKSIMKPIRHAYILPIVGHGSTDLFDIPVITIISHLTSLILIKQLNFSQRKKLLLTISVIHISRDIPLILTYIFNNYFLLSFLNQSIIIYFILSSFFHIIWLRYHNIAKIYLIFIHTPLHYIKTIKNGLIIGKISLAFITTIITYYVLNRNIDIMIKDHYGELWWTAPILGHIILDELIMIKTT